MAVDGPRYLRRPQPRGSAGDPRALPHPDAHAHEVPGEGAMRFAYADPPYLGCSVKLYGDHPDAATYDSVEGHAALIEKLVTEYPDGWALSASSSSLQMILGLCPSDIRVLAWVKPFASFKPGVGVAYAWEPIIVLGGRRLSRDKETVRDWISKNITLKRGFTGAKPSAVVFWLLAVLNVQPGDEFDDLFPGSGAVTAALDGWRASHTGESYGELFAERHRNHRRREL